MHFHTLISDAKEKKLNSLIRNIGVPERLFASGLRLYSESLLAYYGAKTSKGDIRFYPPTIMTFWSGFETYVRFATELLLITAKEIPPIVADYLREHQRILDKKGNEKIKDRWQPVLERYALLLRFGYRYEVDRGNKNWQLLEKAKDLRDYYTHLDLHEPRAVSSGEVLHFMETVLLALIWPSCELKRTLMLGIYRQYWTWTELNRLANEVNNNFVEQPLAMDWRLDEHPDPYAFHCNFENVDNARFPSSDTRTKEKQ